MEFRRVLFRSGFEILGKHTKSKSSPIRYVEHFKAGGDAILESARKAGLEGIVSKKANSTYRSGRSDSWAKAKCRPGQEVVIGGWKTTSEIGRASCRER